MGTQLPPYPVFPEDGGGGATDDAQLDDVQPPGRGTYVIPGFGTFDANDYWTAFSDLIGEPIATQFLYNDTLLVIYNLLAEEVNDIGNIVSNAALGIVTVGSNLADVPIPVDTPTDLGLSLSATPNSQRRLTFVFTGLFALTDASLTLNLVIDGVPGPIIGTAWGPPTTAIGDPVLVASASIYFEYDGDDTAHVYTIEATGVDITAPVVVDDYAASLSSQASASLVLYDVGRI